MRTMRNEKESVPVATQTTERMRKAFHKVTRWQRPH